MATATTSKVPALYATPLPDKSNLPAYLYESLRRVQKHEYGTNNALVYGLVGAAGDWRIAPVWYYEGKRKPNRIGPWKVQEKKLRDYGDVGEPRTFETEAEACAFVTELHAARVDRDLSELAKDRIHNLTAEINKTEVTLDGLRAKLAAWATMTNGQA